MARVCATYWYPLYAFIRRKGYDPAAAQDLVHGFFARLLEKGDLARVDPARGKPRSFLLASCTHYLANRRDHDRARKRGGDRVARAIARGEAEGRYGREPAHGLTAERLFDRRWALDQLGRVLDLLGAEMALAGKAALFDGLKSSLTGERAAAHYAAAARDLGMTEGSVKMAAQRLRRRYRALLLLRAEIAPTVADPAEIDEEIRSLFSAFRD